MKQMSHFFKSLALSVVRISSGHLESAETNGFDLSAMTQMFEVPIGCLQQCSYMCTLWSTH